MENKKVFNKCIYKFKKGAREGQICGASCKTSYCKNHNEHRLQYCEKYYEKKNEVNSKLTFKEKVAKIKKMAISKFKSMSYYNSRVTNLKYECGALYKKILGVGLILDPSYYEKIVDRETKKREMTISHRNPAYFEFVGKKSEAKNKFNEYMDLRKRLLTRYKRATILRDIAEKKYNKYFEENGQYPSNY